MDAAPQLPAFQGQFGLSGAARADAAAEPAERLAPAA